jgi:hypothetical protein
VGTGTGWMEAVLVRTVGEMKGALERAVTRVGREGEGMVIEVLM